MRAMAGRREEIEIERAETAERALRRAGEAEVVGRSNLAHGSGPASETEGRNDPAEIWGRRVGRGLGYIAVIVLVLYLVATYAG
jgi:hypothetical protein